MANSNLALILGYPIYTIPTKSNLRIYRKSVCIFSIDKTRYTDYSFASKSQMGDF